MRRASATGLLDNLGGEGQPLPESHGRDSSMGQATIQQLRRVARRGPGGQQPGARLSPFSPRPDSGLTTAHLVSMHCSGTRSHVPHPLRAGSTRRPRLRGGEGLCTARAASIVAARRTSAEAECALYWKLYCNELGAELPWFSPRAVRTNSLAPRRRRRALALAPNQGCRWAYRGARRRPTSQSAAR